MKTEHFMGNCCYYHLQLRLSVPSFSPGKNAVLLRVSNLDQQVISN